MAPASSFRAIPLYRQVEVRDAAPTRQTWTARNGNLAMSQC